MTGHWEKVRPGEAGRRIVSEARDIRAAAIVLTVPRRAPGGSPLGRTIETVLEDRPCRVVVESSPPQATARVPAAA